MRFDTGGYSARQYDNTLLKRTAKELAVALPKIMAKTGATAVVVTGKSGISMIFAAAMLADLPIVVVRKPNESTHGSMIEAHPNTEVHKYLFVDDFCSSGATFRRVGEALREAYDVNPYKRIDEEGKLIYELPECVGVVEYCHSKEYEGGGCRDDYSSEFGCPMFYTSKSNIS